MAPARPLSVLIVDDVADAADSLSVLLAAHGYAVRVARDGPAALALAAADPPDVVLTDLAMPGMTGWELARRLKGQPGGDRPFVVAVSGRVSEEDHRRSVEAGIDLHLAKPAEPAKLVELLQRFVPTDRPSDAD